MPPVAMMDGLHPSSCSIRVSRPFIMSAWPQITPLRMLSSVFFPMTCFGGSRLIFGSWAVIIILGALYIFLLRDRMSPLTFMSIVTGVFLVATVLMDLWIETKGVQRFNEL